MNDRLENQRQRLLDGLGRFMAAARSVAGVQRIALVGSIVTAKQNPKDIDVLVVVADDADLPRLAMHARRLQGHAQSFNRGADVFLADEQGNYIGRTCRWKDCRRALFAAFRRVLAQMAAAKVPVQIFLSIAPESTPEQDALYAHTPNPNGTPFPHVFERFRWDRTPPPFLRPFLENEEWDVGVLTVDGEQWWVVRPHSTDVV